MPTLIYHGHACFEIHGAGSRVIIDPYLSGNPLADVGPERIRCDAILLSHGHGDHLGDTEQIARANDALVIGTFELASFLQQRGLKTHPLHIGGGRQFPFGHVRLTPALHGGGIEGDSGQFTTTAAGLLITMDDKTIYHAGDTGLTIEMEVLGRCRHVDAALLPIGDNFTMGPEDALIAVQMIRPRTVIPMHYNTFGLIEQDPDAFALRVEQATDAKCIVLKPGQSHCVS